MSSSSFGMTWPQVAQVSPGFGFAALAATTGADATGSGAAGASMVAGFCAVAMALGEAPLNIWSFCVVMVDAPVFAATAAVRVCEFCATCAVRLARTSSKVRMPSASLASTASVSEYTRLRLRAHLWRSCDPGDQRDRRA